MAHHRPKLLNPHTQEKTKTNTNTLKKWRGKRYKTHCWLTWLRQLVLLKDLFFLQKINRRFIATNTKNLHIIKHSQKASINEDWWKDPFKYSPSATLPLMRLEGACQNWLYYYEKPCRSQWPSFRPLWKSRACLQDLSRFLHFPKDKFVLFFSLHICQCMQISSKLARSKNSGRQAPKLYNTYKWKDVIKKKEKLFL